MLTKINFPNEMHKYAFVGFLCLGKKLKMYIPEQHDIDHILTNVIVVEIAQDFSEIWVEYAKN